MCGPLRKSLEVLNDLPKPILKPRTDGGSFLRATFPDGFSHNRIARGQRPQAELRSLMPALAGKTDFSNPALPFCSAEKHCTPGVLGAEESGL